MERNTIRKMFFAAAFISAGFMVSGCAGNGAYNAQKGAAIGGAVGAAAGQLIGHDTESTLIGTGVGAFMGNMVGDAVDQKRQMERENAREAQTQNRGSDVQVGVNPGSAEEVPPGEWVTVSGRWEQGRWIPPHREWRAVNP